MEKRLLLEVSKDFEDDGLSLDVVHEGLGDVHGDLRKVLVRLSRGFGRIVYTRARRTSLLTF